MKKEREKRNELIKNKESDVETHEYISGLAPAFPRGISLFRPQAPGEEGRDGGGGQGIIRTANTPDGSLLECRECPARPRPRPPLSHERGLVFGVRFAGGERGFLKGFPWQGSAGGSERKRLTEEVLSIGEVKGRWEKRMRREKKE